MRKILLIILFIIVSLGLGFALYFIFFKAPEEKPAALPTVEKPTAPLPLAGVGAPRPPLPEEMAPSAAGLPPAKVVRTTDLTIAATAGITISSDGQTAQFYDSTNGRFYKVSPDGALTLLSNKQFFEVQKVFWSNDKNKAVLEYPDGSNIIYNFTTGGQTTLPKHWQDFEFTADDNKIISKSLGADPDNRWLIISEANGTNSKAISALGDNANKVQIAPSPDAQVVAFSKTGDPIAEFGTQEIFLIGQNNENFKSLKVRGFNFKAEWTPEGDRILYSATDPENGYRPSLWAVDSSGDNIGRNSVKINLNTWVDKCAILAGYKAYCAVPKILDEGAGLQPQVADTSDDIFYFVNLKTGQTNFLAEPEGDVSINQISISQNEDYIYFTDKATGALHQIKIK